jgi:hypothetical protein
MALISNTFPSQRSDVANKRLNRNSSSIFMGISLGKDLPVPARRSFSEGGPVAFFGAKSF